MAKRKRLTCKSEISGLHYFQPDVTVLEAMQVKTGTKDEALIYIRGENIEEITDALDDIINRRQTC